MRISFPLGLVVLLVVSSLFSGCDFVYRLLQREGAEEKAILGEVLPFEYNPRVEKVQKFLKLYGYNPGKADGKVGIRTREAIGAFQKGEGLKVTRFVDKQTWERLSLLESVGLSQDGEVDMKVIQQALINAGYASGKIDGLFGPVTIRALKKFQEAHDLKPDGIIGAKTLKALKDYLPVP